MSWRECLRNSWRGIGCPELGRGTFTILLSVAKLAIIATMQPSLFQRPSEREYYSGKVPLRPIHRAGFLIAGGAFVFFSVLVVAIAISTFRQGSIILECLMVALMLGWFAIFFTLGRRMIWSALTAPSEKNDKDEELGISTPKNIDHH